MSSKYPNKPDRIHSKITIDDRKSIIKLKKQYHNLRKELFTKKRITDRKMVSFGPDLVNIGKKKMKII